MRTEERALRDLNCFAEATHGEMDKATLTLLVSVKEVHEQGCFPKW